MPSAGGLEKPEATLLPLSGASGGRCLLRPGRQRPGSQEPMGRSREGENRAPLHSCAFPIFSVVFHLGGGGRGSDRPEPQIHEVLEASLCYMGPCPRKQKTKLTKRIKDKKKLRKTKQTTNH